METAHRVICMYSILITSTCIFIGMHPCSSLASFLICCQVILPQWIGGWVFCFQDWSLFCTLMGDQSLLFRWVWCKLVCNIFVFIIGLTNLFECLTDLSAKCIDNSLHLAQKYDITALGICQWTSSFCSEKQTDFQQHSLRKTVSVDVVTDNVTWTNIEHIFVTNKGYNMFTIL